MDVSVNFTSWFAAVDLLLDINVVGILYSFLVQASFRQAVVEEGLGPNGLVSLAKGRSVLTENMMMPHFYSFGVLN